MTPRVSNESELYVAPSGPMFRVLQRFARPGTDFRAVVRRIVVLLLITWVPMCLLSIVQGSALSDVPRKSFLLDFATYARFFVGIPILVYAEIHIGARLRWAGLQFVREGFVAPAAYPAFETAIATLAKRRESAVATLVLIVLALYGAWNLTYESASGVVDVGWQSVPLPAGHDPRYSLAGLWNQFIAVPVLLFLWFRWLWRIYFWSLFLRDVARLDLRLVATHADAAGGLGFLEVAHSSFAMLAFAVGSVLSAQAAFQILYEGAGIKVFQTPVIVMVVVVEVLFLGPLLLFSPSMTRARRAALESTSALVIRYNRGFEEKWIDGQARRDEPLLGSADIQSLADLGTGFGFVKAMGSTPIGRVLVIQLALATLLPGSPLLLLVVPLQDIIDAVAKLVI